MNQKLPRTLLVTADSLQASAYAATDRPGRLLADLGTGAIVATSGDAETRRGAADVVVDFPGGVLFPALIDTHTHLVHPGDGSSDELLLNLTEAQLVDRSLHNARTALIHGVTVLGDQGGTGLSTIKARGVARRTKLAYPELLVAGRPITTPKGHMSFHGGGTPDEPHSVAALARELVAQGVDFLKLVTTGGGTPGTNPYLPQFSSHSLRAATDVAHAAGLKSMAHCACTVGIVRAVEAGVDVIHHANFFDPDGVRRFDPRVADAIATSGIYVDPTLWVTCSLFEIFGESARDGSAEAQAVIERARRHWEGKIVDVQRLHQAGVQFVVGSDAGYRMSKFGETWREIVAMRDVAMSVAEALSAGTDRAAKALGLGDRTGTLHTGMQADFLVLKGNPLDDLKHLARPLAVYRLGVRV